MEKTVGVLCMAFEKFIGIDFRAVFLYHESHTQDTVQDNVCM